MKIKRSKETTATSMQMPLVNREGAVHCARGGRAPNFVARAAVVIFLVYASVAGAFAAEPAASGLLQKGLYEEEANHDLKAAIEAYQALVAQFDAQRAAVATAVFRLGECYRKQGKTNEAAAFYQRILRDFTDQTELARLSKAFAPALIAARPSGGESAEDKQKRAEIQTRINDLQEGINSLDAKIEQAKAQQAATEREYLDARKLLEEAREYPPFALPIQAEDVQFSNLKKAYAREALNQPTSDEERKKRDEQLQYLSGELKRWIDQLHIPKLKAALDLAERRRSDSEHLLIALRNERKKWKEEVNSRQVKLSELSTATASVDLKNLSPVTQQRKELIEEEIRLVEQQLQSERRKVEAGVSAPENVIKLQRDILTLKREMLALDRSYKDILDVSLATNINTSASANTTSSASANEKAPDGTTPATEEEAKELQRIKAIIKDSPDLVNASDRGFTPLQRAANAGQLAVAEFLLAHNADVNGTSANQRGSTPLHFAAWSGHKTMAELLITHGADVNPFGPIEEMNFISLSRPMRTPLHAAVEQGHNLLTQLLLANKADVNAKVRRVLNDSAEWLGDTPLFRAVENGRKDLAELLVAAGADVNAKNDSGRTPLFQAIFWNRRPMLDWLIEHKAELNIADAEGSSPLSLAVRNDNRELVEVLLTAGADPNFKPKDTSKFSPILAIALHTKAVSERGDLSMLKLLRSRGADVNTQFANGLTPICIAYYNQYKAALEWLLSQDVDVNLSPQNEPSILGQAVKRGDRPFIETLMKHKVNLNAQGLNGWTALHWAVSHNQKYILEFLLANHADPTLKDTQGRTPLDLATDPQVLQPPINDPTRTEIIRLLSKPAQ